MARVKDHKKDRVLVKRLPDGPELEYWREIADRFVAKGKAKIIKVVKRYESPEDVEAQKNAESKKKATEEKKEEGEAGGPGGGIKSSDGGILD